jgi:hypothetical protein
LRRNRQEGADRQEGQDRQDGSTLEAALLKGTRDGILKRVQPVSIHGQISWDVFFTSVEDPDGQITVARIGPEAVVGNNLEPGDRIQVEYLVGVPVKVTRVVSPPAAPSTQSD